MQIKRSIVGVGILLLVVAGLIGFRLVNQNETQFTRSERDPSSVSSHVVATINGAQITRDELDHQIEQLTAAGQLPPLEGSSEEDKQALRQAVLDQMIAEQLLLHDAASQGITVSEADVETQVNLIREQLNAEGGDFDQLLAAQGVTASDLRQSLHDQLRIEAYFSRLGEEHDIEVSEDEVRQTYDTQVSEQDAGISFEDAEPQIRGQLEQQKIAAVLPEIIAELREQAEVEITL